MFILWPCFLWQRHPYFYLYRSCLAAARSQKTHGISISSSLSIFLSLPHLASVQFKLYYWMEYYMKHITKVSKYYTGKAPGGGLSWIKAENRSDHMTAGALVDWCPVKPWGLLVRGWVAVGIVWRNGKSGDLTGVRGVRRNDSEWQDFSAFPLWTKEAEQRASRRKTAREWLLDNTEFLIVLWWCLSEQ